MAWPDQPNDRQWDSQADGMLHDGATFGFDAMAFLELSGEFVGESRVASLQGPPLTRLRRPEIWRFASRLNEVSAGMIGSFGRRPMESSGTR